MSKDYAAPRIESLGTVAEMTEADPVNILKFGSLSDNEGLLTSQGQPVVGEHHCTFPPGSPIPTCS
jgi:hypothetical protein